MPEEKSKNYIFRFWDWLKGGKKPWEQRKIINDKLFLIYFQMIRDNQGLNEWTLFVLKDLLRGFFESMTIRKGEKLKWDKILEQSTVIKVTFIFFVFLQKAWAI